MMKMTKQFLVAAVALTAFTACSDSYLSEADNVVLDPVSNAGVLNSAVLTDANGQQIASVSSNFGTYYLDIKTDGIWYIEIPDNMEFTPTKMFGRGNSRVPVLIGNNWAESRQLSYKVKFLDEDGQPLQATTRGDGDGSQTVTQQSKTDLASFEKIINSNTFVGYGFNPSKNAVPELCTGIMVFKMDDLNKTANVRNSLSPQSKQYYYYAHSDSVLDKVIAVNGHIGGNFNVVKLGLDLNNFNKTNSESYESTSIQKSMTRTLYSREIEFANLQNDESNFTEGFKYYKQRFISEYKAAGTDAAKKKAMKDFFGTVGTHFISKALLGCELDYRMEFSSTKVKNVLDVKAALDFKWQQQVKDTAQVDSATKAKMVELMNDSTKRKNFFVNGNVQYSDSAFNAATSTTAQVKARGGDVEMVNILTTGGSLENTQLAAWMLSTEPEKATMTYMMLQPIYVLFMKDDEKEIYNDLRTTIEKDYNMDPVVGNYGKLE